MAKYWIESTERIMDNLDCSSEQKLEGVVSLLRYEACQWWLIVKEGTQLERLTWEFFKTTFQGKYGDRSVVEYETKFLQLSHYARGMVETEYERYVRFEDGLRDTLRVLITPQKERDFSSLMEKAKIIEEVKHVERQNCDRERGRNKRDSKPSSSVQRPKKNARADGPVRAGLLVIATGLQLCVDCGRRY
ncbi:uncharacterized protein LOC105775409 [Gossypium raimondii]|uniref:uncharacterized protein LOC105775409 n=1 Tax=Gossypium raimondii TaxID=29730 RepID=UPI00227D657F|nr:uncharacterized protein LOC105775409 [Gossypium raimondii]